MTPVEDLMNRFLDDGLDANEHRELETVLGADSRAVDQLFDLYQQDRLLAVLCRPSQASTIEAILEAVLQEDRFVDATMRRAHAMRLERPEANRGRDSLAAGDNASSRKPLVTLDFTSKLQQFFLRPRWALALAAVVLAVVMFWLFPTDDSKPTLSLTGGAAVTLQRNGSPLAAESGMRLLPGDILKTTGTNQVRVTATITFAPEATRILVQPGSELRLVSMSHGKSFDLRLGKLEASVARQRPFRPMTIRTPQAESRVVGTKFTLTVRSNATWLDVSEGKVRLTRTSDGAAIKVPTGHYAIAATNAQLSSLPATGKILREVWTNYPGSFRGSFFAMITSDPIAAEHPSEREYLMRFETQSKADVRFGQRVRGYVHPPATGDYRFSASATGSGLVHLFLSLDDKPENRVQVWNDGTGPQYTGPSPPPTSIPLVAGRRYYIEALHVADGSGGGLSVLWQGPEQEMEVIPGEFLSPFLVKEMKGKE